MPNARTAATVNAQTIDQETVNAVIKDAQLAIWIDRLMMLESEGREDIVIVDTNGRLSKGCLQFQDATFNSYAKRYGIEGEIMNCGDQKKLATLMIQENPRNARHWYTSVFKRGLGPPPGSGDAGSRTSQYRGLTSIKTRVSY